MEVTVRDRSAEPPWGHGPLRVAVRTITIDDNCPECGDPRGTPEGMNQYDDGVHYWVQTWSNPCGHADPFVKVIKEAEARGTLGKVWLK
jgi:hypothetical protein